jgi:hypothetical protein
MVVERNHGNEPEGSRAEGAGVAEEEEEGRKDREAHADRMIRGPIDLARGLLVTKSAIVLSVQHKLGAKLTDGDESSTRGRDRPVRVASGPAPPRRLDLASTPCALRPLRLSRGECRDPRQGGYGD